ncbi:MAG: bifunctional phosphoglucose/phosphomannose isomerase [Chloroflexota bacterium]
MTAEVDLDDPRTYARLDPDDMYRRIAELSAQMDVAWRLADHADLPASYGQTDHVLIAGMGGSAIGGSLLESYTARQMTVPVSVWRNYGLPAWVDQNTLLIAVSYSGSTEETISAFREGQARGAKLLAISTGGEIERLAREFSAPVLKFQYPAKPRATVGYLFTPLVRIMERLGLLGRQQEDFDDALSTARRMEREYGGDMPASENAAKRLAQACVTKAVVIYGADYLSAVARRWKTQMNENAKSWSFFAEFPELDHNAIVGYEYPKGLGAAIEVIMLDAAALPARIRLRMDVTQKLLQGFGVSWDLAQAAGAGPLAQIYSLVSLGDFTSYYLALLNGVDPSIMEPIDFLKDQLALQQQSVPPAS